MMPLSPATRIFLSAQAVDLRRSFEGLSDLIQHHFQQDPLSGHLYVFTNKRRNRIKLLYADDSGIWLCAKRLHGHGTFAWPRTTETGALQIWAQELTLLLSGIDLEKTAERSWWRSGGGKHQRRPHQRSHSVSLPRPPVVGVIQPFVCFRVEWRFRIVAE